MYVGSEDWLEELLIASGWEPAGRAALERLRERQERGDLEQTVESGRLLFMRWLYETGRLTDRRRKRP